jgi:cobalamin synthase
MSQLEQFMTASPLPPSRNRRTWGKFLAAIIALGLLVGMIAAAFVLLRGNSDSNDYAGSGTGQAVVVVGRGDTITEIGQKL